MRYVSVLFKSSIHFKYMNIVIDYRYRYCRVVSFMRLSPSSYESTHCYHASILIYCVYLLINITSIVDPD